VSLQLRFLDMVCAIRVSLRMMPLVAVQCRGASHVHHENEIPSNSRFHGFKVSGPDDGHLEAKEFISIYCMNTVV